jgi:nicotinamide-nucleotide amidase
MSAAGAELVLITGGLGPTEDDLTRWALADAMGSGLIIDEGCLAEIEEFFGRRGRTMIDANKVQAMIPVGAEAISNRMGTAPGIAADVGGAKVYVTPGVPSEMKCMYVEQIAPGLGQRSGAIAHHMVHTFGIGESDLGARIGDLMARGANPLVGTTVAAGKVSIRIIACSDSDAGAVDMVAETVAEIRRRLGTLVFGEGEQTLASVVGEMLRARGQTLSTAESCTGGLIGQRITATPGASEYYLGGTIAYANTVKERALGVTAEALAAEGAVSEPVAEQMVRGSREATGSDWAISVTGIAGPAGGSDEKPVGLVYIGIAGPDICRVHRHVLGGTRDLIRHRTAMVAMNHLRMILLAGGS